MSQSPSLPAAAAVLIAVTGAAAVPQAMAQTIVPVDVETRLGGIDVACTGIGADARAEPRWQTYGVRVEFSNARNEYLAGGEVTVRDVSGAVIFSARCEAPWLLMRLPGGRYAIEGRVPDARPRSAAVTSPRAGQMRVVLQFPEL